jgi:hypothetical protein
MGLEWTPFAPISNVVHQPGMFLYRLRAKDVDTVCYIGQTSDLSGRMRDHASTFAPVAPEVSHLAKPLGGGIVHALELENDLIGAFFASQGTAPRFQFRAGTMDKHLERT